MKKIHYITPMLILLLLACQIQIAFAVYPSFGEFYERCLKENKKGKQNLRKIREIMKGVTSEKEQFKLTENLFLKKIAPRFPLKEKKRLNYFHELWEHKFNLYKYLKSIDTIHKRIGDYNYVIWLEKNINPFLRRFYFQEDNSYDFRPEIEESSISEEARPRIYKEDRHLDSDCSFFENNENVLEYFIDSLVPLATLEWDHNNNSHKLDLHPIVKNFNAISKEHLPVLPQFWQCSESDRTTVASAGREEVDLYHQKVKAKLINFREVGSFEGKEIPEGKEGNLDRKLKKISENEHYKKDINDIYKMVHYLTPRHKIALFTYHISNLALKYFSDQKNITQDELIPFTIMTLLFLSEMNKDFYLTLKELELTAQAENILDCTTGHENLYFCNISSAINFILDKKLTPFEEE